MPQLLSFMGRGDGRMPLWHVPFLSQLKELSLGKRALLHPQINGTGCAELEKPKRNFLSQISFYYYYSCQESTREIFICIKTYIRRRKKKRQTRVCPTKRFFEPSSIPLSSSVPHSPQRWNLGSRLNGSRLLMERVSPEHTSRRLARH